MKGPKDAAMAILSGMDEESAPGTYLEMEDGEEEEMEDYDEEQIVMAEELLSAMDEGDPVGVLDALRGLIASV